MARKDAPEWALRITELRASLGVSQVGLSKRLRIAQATVSKWESASKEPSAKMYQALSELLPDDALGRYFRERAVERTPWLKKRVEEIRAKEANAAAMATIHAMLARGAAHRGSVELKMPPAAVAIPLLHDSAAAGSPRMIEQAEVEDTLVLPQKMCPHPKETVALRIAGDSMSPTLEDGYIVLVDAADTEQRRLFDQMVAARDPDGGITIKWLRKIGGEPALVPQHTSLRHQIVMLARGWTIIGRVVGFIGTPPAPRRGGTR